VGGCPPQPPISAGFPATGLLFEEHTAWGVHGVGRCPPITPPPHPCLRPHPPPPPAGSLATCLIVEEDTAWAWGKLGVPTVEGGTPLYDGVWRLAGRGAPSARTAPLSAPGGAAGGPGTSVVMGGLYPWPAAGGQDQDS
jgi:hypothetical protein